MANDRKIGVLHFSSHDEECGVAKYLEHYIKGMEDVPEIENEYFEVSPYATPGMSASDLDAMAVKLRLKLKDFDILHVQHEFALYAHDSFRRIVEAGKQSGKKIVITVHISPSLHGASKPAHLKGLGPHSLVLYLRDARHYKWFVDSYIEPFKMADIVIVHNEATANSLKGFGIAPYRIKKLAHPVQAYDTPTPSKRIATALNKKHGDVIYCTIGYLHRFKGIVDAVKALKYLPENYKLAILGGMKEDNDDIGYYNKLTDLISDWGLRDRVYITGYVPTDNELNGAIRECDMCVYPFDRVYYSNVSSGSFNQGFANGMPVVAYPTDTIKEMAEISGGAVVLTETFAYYELARSIQSIDLKKQRDLSRAYAEKAAWPKVSKDLAKLYADLATS